MDPDELDSVGLPPNAIPAVGEGFHQRSFFL